MAKVGLIAIASVFLALLLKKEKSELALLLSVTASVLIFGYALSGLSAIVGFLKELMETLPVDDAFLTAIVKMLGIAYIADFSAAICREAGFAAIAGQIELFARLSIVALSVPELWYLLQMIGKLCGADP